jgi:hypothetical protein
MPTAREYKCSKVLSIILNPIEWLPRYEYGGMRMRLELRKEPVKDKTLAILLENTPAEFLLLA